MKFRRALAVLFVIALPAIALSAIHKGFSMAAWSEIERRGLTEKSHNAIKHAYAASEFYSAVRPFLGARISEAIVVKLGIVNEWTERYLRLTTDWSDEVYKDLRNNLAGIAAAEWIYGQEGYTSPRLRLRLIGKLAADNELTLTRRDPRLPVLPKAPDTASAVEKMEEDQPELRAQLAEDIARMSEELRGDLGLN